MSMYLEKGICVDNEGRAVVGPEVRGECGCRVVGETCSLKIVGSVSEGTDFGQFFYLNQQVNWFMV